MTYKEELTQAMTKLANDKRTLFLGQSVCYSGQAMFPTLEGVPFEKRIEMPIAEEMQMGISIGLSIVGFIPISLYSRMDFLLLAMNQLVNHLDKIVWLSKGEFMPKVIIRTLVGSKTPLDGGLQHTQDYSEVIKPFIPNIEVFRLTDAECIIPCYQEAMRSPKSSLMVEYGDKYGD